MTAAIVLGDLHLRSDGDPAPRRALTELLAREPDAPLVLAGDTLDLAAERSQTPAEATRAVLASAPELCRLLAERASRGVTTTFLAGNHDAAIGSAAVVAALHDHLGLDARDRAHVRAEPWFVHLAAGAVHVEHGHVFDPDSAPTHPLSTEQRDDVGIRVLRKFIVPIGAHDLVHANAEVPLALLLRVIRKYGPHAPSVVARYVSAAVSIVRESGARFPMREDRDEGARRLAEFAFERALDGEALALVLQAHATPTMAHATSTFLRLYLDRVFATAALVTGVGVATTFALTASAPIAIAGVSLATLGALSLTASLIAGANRYHGRAQRALADGAERVAAITSASTVILGHVHADVSGPHYRNTASFAFATPGARPYLRVEDDGAVRRAFA